MSAPPSPHEGLGHIPTNGPECRQIDRVVQEIDGLAKVLIDDGTRFHRKDHAGSVAAE